MKDIAKRTAIALSLIGAMLLGLHILGPQGILAAKQPDASSVTVSGERPLKDLRTGKQQPPAPREGTDEPDDPMRQASAGDMAELQGLFIRALDEMDRNANLRHAHGIATYAAGVEETKRSLAEELAKVKAELAELRAALPSKPKPPAAPKRTPKPKSEPLAAKQSSIGPWSTATTRTLHAVNSGVPPLRASSTSDP